MLRSMHFRRARFQLMAEMVCLGVDWGQSRKSSRKMTVCPSGVHASNSVMLPSPPISHQSGRSMSLPTPRRAPSSSPDELPPAALGELKGRIDQLIASQRLEQRDAIV